MVYSGAVHPHQDADDLHPDIEPLLLEPNALLRKVTKRSDAQGSVEFVPFPTLDIRDAHIA